MADATLVAAADLLTLVAVAIQVVVQLVSLQLLQLALVADATKSY